MSCRLVIGNINRHAILVYFILTASSIASCLFVRHADRFVAVAAAQHDWSRSFRMCRVFRDDMGRPLLVSGDTKFDASSNGQSKMVLAPHLNSPTSWRPNVFDARQWLSIDLMRPTLVTAIGTQGRGTLSEFVTVFALAYSDDGYQWFDFTDAHNIIKYFDGNSDQFGVKVNNFSVPIVARYLRIRPLQWNNFIALRLELYGCAYDPMTIHFEENRLAYYDMAHAPLTSDQNVLRLRFRTNQPSGVLMYADSEQNNDFVTIELDRGALRVAIDLGSTVGSSGETVLHCASLLDDYQWHNVEVRHERHSLFVVVDQIECRAHSTSVFLRLNIDGRVYAGGVSTHQKRGVLARANFVGCMQDLQLISFDMTKGHARFIDLFAGVLSGIAHFGIENGVTLANYCPVMGTLRPFTLPDTHSLIVYSLNSDNDRLSVSLEFRTFASDGILLHHVLLANKHSPVTTSAAYILLYLQNAELVCELSLDTISVTFPRKHSFAHRINTLNDGRWHAMHVKLQRGRWLNVSIDGESEMANVDFDLSTSAEVQLGGSTHFTTRGFVGCLRRMRINDIDLTDANVAVKGTAYSGACYLKDHCSPNPCENGGICTQSHTTFTCDCSLTNGFGGAVCHTVESSLSCQDYKHAMLSAATPLIGASSLSGNWVGAETKWKREADVLVDVDWTGPLKPFYVHCRFDSVYDDTNSTMLGHLIEPDTLVPDGYALPGSYRQDIVYKASVSQMREVIRRAHHCRQYVEFKCRGGTRLFGNEDSPFSWWTSVNKQHISSWGDAEMSARRCACGLKSARNTCVDAQHHCNCDAAQVNEQTDAGYITNKQHLPILRVNFGDTGKAKSAKYTVGPVICEGDSMFENMVTFRKIDAGLEIYAAFEPNIDDVSFDDESADPLTFDLRLDFRTARGTGILVHALSVASGDFVELRLQSPRELSFRFNAGRGTEVIVVATPYDLNDLAWHTVRVERNRKESTLAVDKFTQRGAEEANTFRALRLRTARLVLGASVLYRDGFVGCVRVMFVQGHGVDLIALTRNFQGHTRYGVSAGCVGKCDSKPCLNGGVCHEHYDGFTCDCTFTPFRGPVCGTEIGTQLESDNMIKYTLPNIGYVGSEEEVIQAQFSTYRKTGIIMQILSDRRDDKGLIDFFSIEINNNGGIRVRFHLGFDAFEYNSMTFLSNGQSHAVYIKRDVEGRRLTIRVDSQLMQTFWFNKTDEFDRIFDSPRFFYIGRNETMTDEEGFTGCISRLQFNRIYPLKFAFLEVPDPLVNISGKPIRAYMCDIEPAAPEDEPVEVPPNRPIKIIRNPLPMPTPDLFWPQYAVFLLMALVVLCTLAYVVVYWVYVKLFREGWYRTKEEVGATYALSADAAMFNVDNFVLQHKEWFANDYKQRFGTT